MKSDKPLYDQGHEFHGPNGQGYRALRKVCGGAPISKDGEDIAPWLVKIIVSRY